MSDPSNETELKGGPIPDAPEAVRATEPAAEEETRTVARRGPGGRGPGRGPGGRGGARGQRGPRRPSEGGTDFIGLDGGQVRR